jgi:hypothetical protein
MMMQTMMQATMLMQVMMQMTGDGGVHDNNIKKKTFEGVSLIQCTQSMSKSKVITHKNSFTLIFFQITYN